MSLAIAPENLRVYKDILSLIWRHGNHEALDAIGLGKLAGRETHDRADADSLAEDLEDLGPTYIKIGQLLSTQLDLLPPQYMEAMARLQDDIEPLPFPELLPIIEESLEAPLLSIFSEVDTTPLGSASLGQVHRGVLRDGREVAIKIQRPGAPAQIAKDFEGLRHVAKTLDGLTEQRYNLEVMIDHTRKQLEAELDYRKEANNLRHMRRLMQDEDQIVVPEPVAGLDSKRVLVMEYLVGEKLTELSPRRIQQLDGSSLATTIFKKYLDHILVEGFYHADPHPGNVLIDQHNRVLLLDLGMVGRLAPRFRERLTQLVLAIVDGRGEDAAETAIAMGDPKPGYDRDAFARDIGELVLDFYNESIDGMNLGSVVLKIARTCGEHHVQIPPQLSTIGRTLLHLDKLGQTLDPGFNPAAAVRSHTVPIAWQDFWQQLNPNVVFGETFEVKRLAQLLPHRLNSILDLLAREDRGFKIDAIDEDRLIHGVEKIANRITYGLIVAALFIGGAMVAGIEDMPLELLGLSILAWIMFAAAAIGTALILGGMAIFSSRREKP